MASKKAKNKAAEPPCLTQKQALFIEAYIGKANGNATEAARLAGYKGNDVTLASVGRENLSKPQIASRTRARVEAAAMAADEVLNELTAIARADWKEFLKISYGREGEILEATLALKDKLRALELLGKYHKLFIEKQELSGEMVMRVIYGSDGSEA